MEQRKAIALVISLLVIISIGLTGCTNVFKGEPNLKITSIEGGVTYDTDTPYYIGYVKNTGDGTANYTKAKIIVYANEDKNATINVDQYYIGEIKPGQERFFRFNFPEFAPLTDISNYEINFQYD
jgi:hypothetical protein